MKLLATLLVFLMAAIWATEIARSAGYTQQRIAVRFEFDQSAAGLSGWFPRFFETSAVQSGQFEVEAMPARGYASTTVSGVPDYNPGQAYLESCGWNFGSPINTTVQNKIPDNYFLVTVRENVSAIPIGAYFKIDGKDSRAEVDIVSVGIQLNIQEVHNGVITTAWMVSGGHTGSEKTTLVVGQQSWYRPNQGFEIGLVNSCGEGKAAMEAVQNFFAKIKAQPAPVKNDSLSGTFKAIFPDREPMPMTLMPGRTIRQGMAIVFYRDGAEIARYKVESTDANTSTAIFQIVTVREVPQDGDPFKLY